MKRKILGIKIDDVTIDEAVKTVEGWLSKPGKHYIVTPNPEMIVYAQKDTRYKSILNDADLSIPDGVGLKLTGKIKNTLAGVDLMEKLIEKSQDWVSTVGLLGGKERVAEKAADCLRKKYPAVKIKFAESGGEIDNEGNVIARSETTKQSKSDSSQASLSLRLPRPFGARNDNGVDLLFVGFGPPKQEKWIANNLKNLDIKVAMSVGGAFDYISGNVPRAPKWIRNLNFEWLFRLAVQPWRIKRQIALIKYLFMLR